ncbi:g1876 [Coccomyxa elongata]
MRVTLLEERLQGAGEVFEENKLLTTERNALEAALSEEQIRNEKRLSDLERLHVHERNEWEQKLDAQIRSAVSAAEQAVNINGIAKGDIDSELQYQAQQIDFMYDSMKEAKAKMAAMRRELEVSREVQEKLTVQNCALQRAVNALAQRMREERAAQPPDHSAFPNAIKHRPADIAASAASIQKTVRKIARSKHRTFSSVAHMAVKV